MFRTVFGTTSLFRSLATGCRLAASKPCASTTTTLRLIGRPSFATVRPYSSHVVQETPEEFDQRFVDYFNREDIDGWMVRKAMTDLHQYDVIPEPRIVAAALRACRRVNDYALAVRYLECIRLKCGPKKYVQTIYPYIIQEIRSVLDELGISTPEEMGYDKPELFHPDPDWWPKRYYYEYGYDKDPRYTVV